MIRGKGGGELGRAARAMQIMVVILHLPSPLRRGQLRLHFRLGGGSRARGGIGMGIPTPPCEY